MKIPRCLETQSQEQAAFYTHFDCWNDTGNSEEDSRGPIAPEWKWRSAKATKLVNKLMRDWGKTVPGLKRMAKMQNCFRNKEEFFESVGQHFVAAGYCYYLGDAMFEVYHTEDVEDCTRKEWRKIASYHTKLIGIISEVEELLGCDILPDDCDLAKSLNDFKP
jgi:hypothetical protein